MEMQLIPVDIEFIKKEIRDLEFLLKQVSKLPETEKRELVHIENRLEHWKNKLKEVQK